MQTQEPQKCSWIRLVPTEGLPKDFVVCMWTESCSALWFGARVHVKGGRPSKGLASVAARSSQPAHRAASIQYSFYFHF